MVKLLPTVEGCTAGIVSLEPFTLQCAECGALEVPARPVLMTTRFHRPAYAVRQCVACRLAMGCDCWGCNRERADYQNTNRKASS